MKNYTKVSTSLLTLLLGKAFLITAASAITVNADGDIIRIVDWADLLSDSEESDLSDKLDEISERQQIDIVVVTIDSLEGTPVTEYADDFYDYNGYGFGDGKDGILFLISMEERDWYISTSGYGITAFTDAGLGYMEEKFLPYLSDGDYAEAFTVFATQCDDYITQAKTGDPYDVETVPTEPFSPAGALMTAVAAGFVTACIVTGIMRLNLRSVYSQSAADNYINSDGLRLTKEYELFLYRNVTRTEKPKQNNSSNNSGSRTHTSSSGNTHGGGGGKF